MTSEERAALLALAERLRARGSVEVRRLVSKNSDHYDMLPRGTANEGADAIDALLAALAAAEANALAFDGLRHRAVAERDAARAEAARLRGAAREMVEAAQAVRDHPPNDSTRRFDDKLARAEAAHDALAALPPVTPGDPA